ncbi:nucleotidyltransferase family protein [Stutzerimonas nitrititolerans]|uniref:nucleotidyltransferase family protein n=1 Tax=Stutzerimonas nitrititolerans TaxID=2482751 RepID=UPI0028A5895D|nr:nucleotidyltransferase family protein [Stutzerimonas nitrititolerans]
MNNVTEIIISPEATIRDAMRLLDAGAQRIVLICTPDFKLLGTITDGDTRRALLRDAHMHDAVSSVMNTQPLTVTGETTRDQRLKLMKEHDLTAIPIVDEQHHVIGLETLHQAMQPEQRENPIFIMAGGFGTRLQPLTDRCPKPMLRVGDKPMLEHLIKQFVDHGFRNFYISTHFLPEIIRSHFGDGSAWNASIQYVNEDQPLGTGGALGLLPADLPDIPLIMMNGDVLTKLNYAQLLCHHVNNRFDATVCVREDEHRVPFGVIETENKLITSMVEKPTYRYKINTGIYVLNPSIVRSVQPGQRIDMPTLLEQHRQKSKRIGTYTSYDYWLDIGQMKDYQKAQKDIDVYFKAEKEDVSR